MFRFGNSCANDRQNDSFTLVHVSAWTIIHTAKVTGVVEGKEPRDKHGQTVRTGFEVSSDRVNLYQSLQFGPFDRNRQRLQS